MARVHNAPRHLGLYSQLLQRRSDLAFGVYLFATAVFIVFGLIPSNAMFMFIWTMIGLVLVSFIARWASRVVILEVGKKGEDILAKTLDELPDTYVVIHDLLVDVNGKNSQIDHVVVGPNGLFVIEGKYLKGTISGCEDDTYWVLSKRGRGNKLYTRQFYNPIKQVRTQMHRLKEYIQEETGFDPWMEPIVVITHPEAKIEVVSQSPVLRLDEVREHILNYQNRFKMPAYKYAKVLKALMQLSMTEGRAKA